MTTLESIFDEARRLTGAARAAYLDRACDGDAALRERVEALLHADATGHEFLRAEEAEAVDLIATTPGPPSESAGQSIDRYRLLQQLGEGGFGTVWMAEQREPVRRKVAIKIIKVGMDTRQVIARFEAERQALALMDHPNIARVLDAGATARGRPYFVMELVRGVPILAYCDGERLDTRQRLELFVQVCHAIQHAHQKGIIHRDIKPSNVLVTLHDGVATVKVIDFGVAKATSAELTQKTLFTEHNQVIGTPAYMSPEQAEMTGLDIDTRSDVYSLGVLLYELLTGTTPFDQRELMRKGYAEMMRIIREVEPHRPSSRLSSLGKTAIRTAELRRADVRRLRSLLRGDLDWIVMKCLEKDRARRFETAIGLAHDIRRHLAGEPVFAAPPSAAYRVRKFARRNRNGVIVASVLAAIVLLGTIGTGAGLVWALRESGRADASALNEYEARLAAQANEARAVVEAGRAERRAYHALLVAADGAIRAGETAAARRFLADAPKDLRGWEWEFLHHQVDRSVLRIQSPDRRGHVVVETPDGRSIVSIGNEGIIRVFDAHSGEHVRNIDSGFDYAVFALANDGSLLALQEGAPGTRYRIIDWQSGQTLWEAHGRIDFLPFDSDDRTIVAAVFGRSELVVHESRTGREVARYAVPAASPRQASFSGDGQRVFYVDDTSETVGVVDRASGSVDVWSPPTWGLDRAIDPRHGRLVMYDNASEQLLVYDIAMQRLERRIDIEPLLLQQPQFSLDGRRLAAGGRNRWSSVLHVVDLAGERVIAKLRGHDAPIARGCFSRDGERILSIDFGGSICVWEVPEQDNPHSVAFVEASIRLGAVFFDSDSRVACGGWGGVQLWDHQTGELHWDAQLGSEYVERLAVSPDRSMVAVVETFGDLVILATADGTVIHRHPGFADGNTAVEWTPDGTTILLAGACGHVAWVDPSSGRRVETVRVHEIPITATALSRDGRRLAVVAGAGLVAMDNSVKIPAPGKTGSVAIVDVAARAVLDRRGGFPHGLTAATFSHDGAMLALGDSRGGVLIFGDVFADPIARSAVGGSVRSMAFNAAGDRLAVGGFASFTTVIEVGDGTPLLNLEAEYALAVSFGNSGTGREALISIHPRWIVEHATVAPDFDLVRTRADQRRIRMIADDLYRTLIVSSDVLAHLEEGADLLDDTADDLRPRVIRHVRGRGDHVAKLLSDALIASRTQQASADEYRNALRRLDFLEQRHPERAFLFTVLRALVHHRLGDADAARTHLEGAEAIVSISEEWGFVPLAAAILIEHASGNRDRVGDLWPIVQGLVMAAGIPPDETSRQLYGEISILMQSMPFD